MQILSQKERQKENESKEGSKKVHSENEVQNSSELNKI